MGARCERHERARTNGLEILAGALRDDGRGEWTERLTILDALIHLAFHSGIARIRENASRPQRSWAELHPTLEPADDTAIRDHPGCHGRHLNYRKLPVWEP